MLAALRSTCLAVWLMFAHISGFTRGATRLPRFPGRECFFNFSESLSEVSFSDHLLLTSLASFSETSWSVCSSAFRSFAIVSSKSSCDSRVRLLFSPFLSSVSLSDSEASLFELVSESDNSPTLGLYECLWPSANRARVSCIELIDWDTDNMSVIFNSVDSNESLAVAEATGIVLGTELFISSSRRTVSSSSLSNSVVNPALSDECFPAIFNECIDSQSPWILDPGWICQIRKVQA